MWLFPDMATHFQLECLDFYSVNSCRTFIQQFSLCLETLKRMLNQRSFGIVRTLTKRGIFSLREMSLKYLPLWQTEGKL